MQCVTPRSDALVSSQRRRSEWKSLEGSRTLRQLTEVHPVISAIRTMIESFILRNPEMHRDGRWTENSCRNSSREWFA